MKLFDRILSARGIDNLEGFLSPNYENTHDPYLMPDMEKAVSRLVLALKNQDKITIYGDYDIDGLCATALMYDCLSHFGFTNLATYIPNRFSEGYGLSESSIKNFAQDGTKLLLTVDCGSRSKNEIKLAKSLGIDVIVTDHHPALDVQPVAVAVVNPKRQDSLYPFADLAGVGVAFKLVQALQGRLGEAVKGYEKWWLDLVALGTVCDIVPLIDENRIFVYWGLKVLAKTRRQGLTALSCVADVKPTKINSRTLGFTLGPRMNASGRLETAKLSLDLLLAKDKTTAFEIAQNLDKLNAKRRLDQDKMLKQAIKQVDEMTSDAVLVVSDRDWNHGIVGIVASKLLEKYHKPVFVLQEMDDKIKGSARSFGEFDVSLAVEHCRDLLLSGGGHKLAAGVSLEVDKLNEFRAKINQYYQELNLSDQERFFLPQADAIAELFEIDQDLISDIETLEPFGNGNPKPVLQTDNLLVDNIKIMGSDGQHIKLSLKDKTGAKMDFLAFNAPDEFFVKNGDKVSVWYQPELNDWQNQQTIEGRLIHVVVRL